MLKIQVSDIEVFLRVSRTRSISEAARQLKITPLKASRALTRLETDVGSKLFLRTTKHCTLSSDGEKFLKAAQGIVDNAYLATANLGQNHDEQLKGLIRISAPATFGRKIMAPSIHELLKLHPELEVDLQLTDSEVNLIEQGIDLAIRISSHLKDSQLNARCLGENTLVLVASRTYIQRSGKPTTIADLINHNCLTITGKNIWAFTLSDGQQIDLKVSGKYTTNSFEALREAALSGLGVSMHSLWDVKEYLLTGEL
jgi:DNA-binding transcriptional LysR family regulator